MAALIANIGDKTHVGFIISMSLSRNYVLQCLGVNLNHKKVTLQQY